MPPRGKGWNASAVLMVGAAAVAIVALAITVGFGGKPVTRPVPSASGTVRQGPTLLAAPFPPPREGAAMAYDAFRHEVVMFGGGFGDQVLNDTWTFQGRRWTKQDPARRPGPLEFARMAYDDRTHTCLLVWSPNAGGPAATWSWDGSNWARLPDVPVAANEYVDRLASDPTTGHVLLLSFVTHGE